MLPMLTVRGTMMPALPSVTWVQLTMMPSMTSATANSRMTK